MCVFFQSFLSKSEKKETSMKKNQMLFYPVYNSDTCYPLEFDLKRGPTREFEFQDEMGHTV